MRDFMVIKDPEVAKLFADPLRRSILHNLRHREMSPYQLAKALGKNVSSIVHHLNALEKAGLVEQSEVRVRGNLIERYYRAAAKVFIISYTLSEGLVPGSEDIAKWSREICRRAVSRLEAFGYHVPPEKADEWVSLLERYAALGKRAFEDIISKQVSPVNIKGPSLQLLLDLLAHVQLYRNPEYVELMEKISQMLKQAEVEAAKAKISR